MVVGTLVCKVVFGLRSRRMALIRLLTLFVVGGGDF